MLTITDLLRALSRRLESDPLHLSNEQQCRVRVDDLELNIEFLPESDAIFVYLPIGLLARDNRRLPLLEALLEANLFYQGTENRATFGYDKNSEEIYLFQQFYVYETNEEKFVLSCVSMIELTKLWQNDFIKKPIIN